VSAERRSGIVKLCIEAGAEKQVAEADLETVARHLSHELLRSVNRGDDADDQAVVLVNALVRQLGCRRVTMAKAHPQGARLLVMSGQTHVDQRRELGSQILQVLENTIADGKARWWPPIEQSPLSAGSQSLVDECVRYFSLNGEKRALLIEWDEDIKREPYDKDELATAIEPTLEFLQNWQARSQGGFAGLKRHVRLNRSRGLLALLPKRYYLLLGSALLLLCSHLIEVPQRVTARVSVEAANRQIISAPQDGLLSISRWEAELRRNDEERNRALATRDRVELGRLRADKTRIKAELASAIAVRDRSELRAPFDALVLKGEPGLSLGAPVVAGQARVRMSAMPSQVLLASLSDVLPVAVAEHGASVYRTPAILMDQGVALRPGMQGVARIEVGKNSLFEVYTRQLRDRLRLLAWRFGILS